MPIDFPNSPTNGDYYSAGGKSWQYNGSAWVLFGVVPTLPSVIRPITVVETASVSATATTGTVNIDLGVNPIVYHTSNASANWTLNFRHTSSVSLDSILANNEMTTTTFMATNGATAYRPTTFQVDGVSVTPKWQGGVAPTAGNINSIDIYTFTILKTASATFTVLATQAKFA